MTNSKTELPKQASVRCPTCERSVKWSKESPFRPFCSERCKLIDLGEWVEERRGFVQEEFPEGYDPTH
ncbi:MAG: DNA gyrase inhibitor YacG [Gammaproteobacteria bacterium]|nr:DNA gyrase inhibitor YacG [Gammaproteobacteria bacterium]MYD79184.1 DNA gyrase inhibitor YacG [Gammaproteobacteria bacterium]